MEKIAFICTAAMLAAFAADAEIRIPKSAEEDTAKIMSPKYWQIWNPEVQKKIDADIEANIGISKDFNNFELCKAVTGQNLEQALRIADHFARNPKDNPLLVTILALFNQFREIFRINYLRWLSRHKGVPFPSDTELIGILRMNNAYALGELKQTSARWDNRRVFRILGLLREYDAKSKGMNAGGAPDGELLRELLLKIFLQ